MFRAHLYYSWDPSAGTICTPYVHYPIQTERGIPILLTDLLEDADICVSGTVLTVLLEG